MAKRDIFVVGGSAGSGAVLKTLLRGLPPTFPGAILITTHVPSNQPGYLADLLARNSSIPVRPAVHGQPIEAGCATVATPDRHLLVVNGVVHLGAGPRENMVRPAIDPMFRSAALTYGPRSVGVVLTGMMNDGAAGLAAIKRMGGTAIVQHPLDAQADQMPRAALEAVEADHTARAADLADVLTQVAAEEAGPPREPPEDLLFEVEVAAGARLGSQALRTFADPVGLTCPECQGVLSEVRGQKPLRYRCQIGHAVTAEALIAQHEAVDEAIRIAMRVMEERVELVSRMARDARATGRTAVAELYEERAAEYTRYAATLRQAALLSRRTSRGSPDQPV
jgi:two-component system chemotaxis response regulator CheB